MLASGARSEVGRQPGGGSKVSLFWGNVTTRANATKQSRTPRKPAQSTAFPVKPEYEPSSSSGPSMSKASNACVFFRSPVNGEESSDCWTSSPRNISSTTRSIRRYIRQPTNGTTQPTQRNRVGPALGFLLVPSVWTRAGLHVLFMP